MLTFLLPQDLYFTVRDDEASESGTGVPPLSGLYTDFFWSDNAKAFWKSLSNIIS